MQEANDNMDELFRRAAENYPLDTSSKDWNKVALALQSEQDIAPPVKKEHRGKFLWLLLLLPLGLICNQFAFPGENEKLASGNKESETIKSVQPGTNQDKKGHRGWLLVTAGAGDIDALVQPIKKIIEQTY